MKATQKQSIEAYKRIQTFLEVYPAPAPASYAQPRAVLEQVVAELSVHGVEQAAGTRLSRAEYRRQQALMQRLYADHLKPISAISRAELEGQPGIEKALQLPDPKLGALKMVNEAKAIREGAALYQPTFVTNGRQPDFLEQLDVAIAAVEGTFSGRAKNIGRRAGAGQAIAKLLRRARAAVRVLDTIVVVAFRDRPEVLGAWDVAKRVHGVSGGGSSVSVIPEPATPTEEVPPQAA